MSSRWTPAQPVLVAAVALLALACSSATGDDDAGSDRARSGSGELGDEALIVPEGLRVTPLAGGNGVLEVIALTLRRGPDSHEVYAALRNEGDVPACSAAFSIELFDQNEQSLAAAIGGLLTPRFYRLTDGSDTLAACVAPGDVSMAALTDLPLDFAIEEVGTVVYRCPYFALDVVPAADLGVRDVRRVSARDGTTSYTGTLGNGLDVALRNPSVSVFPVNRVGRPLGVALGSSSSEIAPGGRWRFETSGVAAHGADQVALPAGAPAQ